MPVIERCDLGELQALGEGDHRSVDDAKRQVQVGLHQFGHAPDVLVLQFSDVEAVAAERVEKGGFRLRSHPRLQQYPTSPSTGEGTSSGPSAWRSNRTHAR